MSEPVQFGDLFRKLRKERGMSQLELAAIAGVGEATIGNLETGVSKKPQKAILELLIAALQPLTPDEENRLRDAAKAETNSAHNVTGVVLETKHGLMCGKHGTTMMFRTQTAANEYVINKVIADRVIQRATIIQYSSSEFYQLLTTIAANLGDAADTPLTLFLQAPGTARGLGSTQQEARIRTKLAEITEHLASHRARMDIRFYDFPATISGALLELDKEETILMLGWYTYEGVHDDKSVTGARIAGFREDTVQISGGDRASIVTWKGTCEYEVLLPTFAALRDNLQLVAHRDPGPPDERARFFGKELAREPVFVYPDFELDERMLADSASGHRVMYHRTNPNSRAPIHHTRDLTSIVAHHDLQAMIFMAEVYQNTPIHPQLMSDYGVSRGLTPQSSFISFGLTSNECTYAYLHKTKNNPLVVVRVGAKNILENMHDPAGAVSLYLPSDGTQYVLDEGLQQQYGVIVRHTPERSAHPQRRWFLVGGLGAQGTPGAGWYLAHHWRKLHALIDGTPEHGPEADRDFLAILECIPNMPNASRIKALYVYDHSTHNIYPLAVEDLP